MCHCMMIRTQCDSVRDRMVAALRSWQNMMRVHCNGESAQTTFPLVQTAYANRINSWSFFATSAFAQD